MTDVSRPDALVVGGGPAGSTAAALLAVRGRHVVLLVRRTSIRAFTSARACCRANLELLDRLGVLDEVAASACRSPAPNSSPTAPAAAAPFPFAQALNKPHPCLAGEARRARPLFSPTPSQRCGPLAKHAGHRHPLRAAGDRATVRAQGRRRGDRFRPRYVLDASGRDTFLAGRMRVKEANKYNNTAAMYAHFNGVERRQGELDGYISIHLAEDGWFWLIPLPGDVMSVGFVGNQSAWKGRQGSAQEVFTRRIASSPTVSARLDGAIIASEIFSTGNYSYRARSGCGEGYLMIGDAYGFVDPMFSTGVLMAMTAGELGAQAADAWLDDPVRGERLARRTNEELARAMDRIGWLIYRINDPVLRSLFMAPRNTLWMRDGIINMLAGNLRGDWRAVLPILSFKTIFHLSSALHRLGLGPAMPEAQASVT